MCSRIPQNSWSLLKCRQVHLGLIKCPSNANWEIWHATTDMFQYAPLLHIHTHYLEGSESEFCGWPDQELAETLQSIVSRQWCLWCISHLVVLIHQHVFWHTFSRILEVTPFKNNRKSQQKICKFLKGKFTNLYYVSAANLQNFVCNKQILSLAVLQNWQCLLSLFLPPIYSFLFPCSLIFVIPWY